MSWNCKIADENELYVDLKSHNRTIKIIGFIDKFISREVIKITHVATYNEMFVFTDHEVAAQSVAYDRYDEMFSPDRFTDINPEAAMSELKSETVSGDSKEEISRKRTEKLHDQAIKHLPLTEKVPVHFYTDGIKSLEMILGFKAKVALEHVLGNKDYTIYDAVRDFAAFATSHE